MKKRNSSRRSQIKRKVERMEERREKRKGIKCKTRKLLRPSPRISKDLGNTVDYSNAFPTQKGTTYV